MEPARFHAITDIPGIFVGHAQDIEAWTGCTVVLCPQGAVAGVDQRGGAPGTRETDALRPLHLVEQAHAILLAGGSAFGLDAASGVMRYLDERGIGFPTGVARVPVVPAAILFDLALGRADVRPDAAMGYQACLQAASGPVAEGNVGAGTGATVGKLLGMSQAMKAGLGSASLFLGEGVMVGALAVVNALGDIVHPVTGKVLAGARLPAPESPESGASLHFADSLSLIRQQGRRSLFHFAAQSNTTLAVVATNASLNKEQANMVAQMAQDGLARVIRPAHTMLDGDTIFALATGEVNADANVIGATCVEVVVEAIIRAICMAAPAAGLPSAGISIEHVVSLHPEKGEN